MEVQAIEAFQDNYIWTLKNNQQQVIVIDPGDARPVEAYLDEHHYQLYAILITHHHHDHVGGVETLIQNHSVPVYGPKYQQLPFVSHPLTEGDIIKFPEFKLRFNVLSLPGHTLDHIAYLNEQMLFCGDTLFSAGCGRLFEGTPEQMFNSLSKLNQLPPSTKVYPAHEYTLKNLAFAEMVEPNNQAIQQYLQMCRLQRQQNKPTLPSTIAREQQINPFFRTSELSIKEAACMNANAPLESKVNVFAHLRCWRDNF